MEVIREAAAWNNGDVCVLFPAFIKWNPQRWLRNGKGSRLIAKNLALKPEIEWKAVNRDTILKAMQTASSTNKARRAEMLVQLTQVLREELSTWCKHDHFFLAQFCVTGMLLVAAWMVRHRASADWWDAVMGSRLQHCHCLW